MKKKTVLVVVGTALLVALSADAAPVIYDRVCLFDDYPIFNWLTCWIL